MAACRFCCTSLDVSHRYLLFGTDAIEKGLPRRFSKVLELPVTEGDGLSVFYCRKCVSKLNSVETTVQNMRSLALYSYAKGGYVQSLCTSPKARYNSRKRVKDTSGKGASPHTVQARPVTKRALGAQSLRTRGKRLTFNSGDSPLTDINPNIPSQQSLSTQVSSPRDSDPTLDVQTIDDPHNDVSIDTSLSCSTQDCLSHTPSSNTSVSGNAGQQQKRTHVVTMTVESPVRASTFSTRLECHFQKLGCALAGGDPKAIAKAALSEATVRECILKKITQQVDEECTCLCSRQPVSEFRKISPAQMENFTWDCLIEELKTKCPIFYRLLMTVVSHTDHRNTCKKGSVHNPGVCMAAAVLFKERNREMTGVQSYLSLVLYNSRVQKKVYLRLNHLNVCTSYPAALSLVTEISKKHREPLERWIKDGADFKFVGDNVAKTTGVRDIRSDHHGQLVQMYSIYTVKSRVNHPASPANFSPPMASSMAVYQCMPSREDVATIKTNLVVLVSRVLCKYIKCLHKYSGSVKRHIPHTYSKEMAMKSEVIVLDVLHKDENKGPEMIDIMDEMHEYIGESSKVRLSGGDYMTVERQRGAKQNKHNSETKRGKLALLEPCVEDWHCLMNVLMNIWKHLFSKSTRDHGTLSSLFTMLRRLPHAKVPKDNMHACQDALLTVYNGHLVAKACIELGISKPDDTPLAMTSIDLNQLANKIVEELTVISDAILGNPIEDSGDGKYNYARVLCHHCSLVTEFLDGWSEGDGKRVLRCWKMFLLHFYSDRRTKYAFESLRLQFQLACLPPHLVSQLTWDRFVNTHGGTGRNIPCDLHNEHINSLFKEIIENMGANFTQQASTKAARAVSALTNMASSFDKMTNIHTLPSAHTRKSEENDLNLVVKELLANKNLQIIENRHHSCFPQIKLNPLHKFDYAKFDLWVKEKMKQHDKYNGQDVTFVDISDLDQ